MTEHWSTEKFREHSQQKPRKKATGQKSLFNRKTMKAARRPTYSKNLDAATMWLVSDMGTSEEELEIHTNRAQDDIKDAGEKLPWCLLIHLLIHRSGHEYTRHHKVHPDQQFGFDFFIEGAMLAVEADGGQHIVGGHQRAAGWQSNMEDRNLALSVGVPTIVFVTDHFEKNPMYIVSTMQSFLPWAH